LKGIVKKVGSGEDSQEKLRGKKKKNKNKKKKKEERSSATGLGRSSNWDVCSATVRSTGQSSVRGTLGT
jgi:hypothetical protein